MDNLAEVLNYLQTQISEHFNGAAVTVEFDEEEEMYVAVVDGHKYICEVGSDDDMFVFDSDHEGDTYPPEFTIDLMPSNEEE